MTREVYIEGRRVVLKPANALGKGGEADVYRLGADRALKVWKAPDHPDLAGLSAEQAVAAHRLDLMQAKLPALLAAAGALAMPASDRPRVVAPLAPATDRSGQRVLGYVMPLVLDAVEIARYGERAFRAAGVPGDLVRRTFLDLDATVRALHRAGVVIGDFNDLNVLVRDGRASLIDVDSYQLGRFACVAYTERFLDPLLCDGREGRLCLDRPYGPGADWYAFAVMLMRSLLFVGPYGGVVQPGPGAPAPAARPLHRFTVFRPAVRYPKPAAPVASLPDELVHHFVEVFEHDLRVPFPTPLLERLRFSQCPSCGLEHARSACPLCAVLVPAPATRPASGRVDSTTLFETAGAIVAAAVEGGRLLWLAESGGDLRREDGSIALRGGLDPSAAVRLLPDETLVATGGRLLRCDRAGGPARVAPVDACGGAPAFDVGGGRAFWADGGQLLRDGAAGPELVGTVLEGQTRFWVGPRFGFGFSRAGELSLAFVFSTSRRGLDDSLSIPQLRGGGGGKLRGVDCAMAADRCWLFLATELAGRELYRCLVVDAAGRVEASIEAADDQGWLDPGCGRSAVGRALLVAGDDGVTRYEVAGGRIARTGFFAEAEPFVDRESRLLAGPDGLVVVTRRSIRVLRVGSKA